MAKLRVDERSRPPNPKITPAWKVMVGQALLENLVLGHTFHLSKQSLEHESIYMC